MKASAPEERGAWAWFALGVLVLATYAGAMNRQLLALNLQPLKVELGLTDMQIGSVIGLGPGLCAGLGGLLLGVMADRGRRPLVLAACVVFWSLATGGLALADSYLGLLAGVVALAMGESSLGPVVASMIPDLFRDHRRVTANVILSGAGGMASGVATILAGLLVAWVTQLRDLLPPPLSAAPPSKAAFLFVAALGIPVAAAILTIRDPRPPAGLGVAADLRGFLRRHGPVMVGVYVAFAMQTFGVAAIATWTPAFLARRFGMDVGDVGAALGSAVTAGGLAGAVAAYLAFRAVAGRLGDRGPWVIYVAGVLMATAPIGMLLVARSAAQVLFLVFLTVVLISMAGSHIASIIQQISPAQLRGRAFAVATLVMSVIPGASPPLVGLLSDRLAPRAGGAGGLLVAMVLCSTLGLALSAALLLAQRPAVSRLVSDLDAE